MFICSQLSWEKKECCEKCYSEFGSPDFWWDFTLYYRIITNIYLGAFHICFGLLTT